MKNYKVVDCFFGLDRQELVGYADTMEEIKIIVKGYVDEVGDNVQLYCIPANKLNGIYEFSKRKHLIITFNVEIR